VSSQQCWKYFTAVNCVEGSHVEKRTWHICSAATSAKPAYCVNGVTQYCCGWQDGVPLPAMSQHTIPNTIPCKTFHLPPLQVLYSPTRGASVRARGPAGPTAAPTTKCACHSQRPAQYFIRPCLYIRYGPVHPGSCASCILCILDPLPIQPCAPPTRQLYVCPTVNGVPGHGTLYKSWLANGHAADKASALATPSQRPPPPQARGAASAPRRLPRSAPASTLGSSASGRHRAAAAPPWPLPLPPRRCAPGGPHLQWQLAPSPPNTPNSGSHTSRCK
jgi:hypothetical protein